MKTKELHFCGTCGNLMQEAALYSSVYWRCYRCEPTGEEPAPPTNPDSWDILFDLFERGVLEKTNFEETAWRSNDVGEVSWRWDYATHKPTGNSWHLKEINEVYNVWQSTRWTPII